MILFFQFFKHFWFPLPVRLLLLKSPKNFTVRKILQLSADHQAGWSLCKLWEHRFSVPDLVSSPLPPPRLHVLCILQGISKCRWIHGWLGLEMTVGIAECPLNFFIKHFWFPLPVRFLLLKSLKIFTVGRCGKSTAIFRWPPRGVTASLPPHPPPARDLRIGDLNFDLCS